MSKRRKQSKSPARSSPFRRWRMWSAVAVVAGVVAYVLSTTQANRTLAPASGADPTRVSVPSNRRKHNHAFRPGPGRYGVDSRREFSMGAQDRQNTNDAVGMQATTDSRPVHRVASTDSGWTRPK